MRIIGAGITGATIARILAERGHDIDIYESGLIGGLCHDSRGFISTYGPHIFHTDDEDVWRFVNRFSQWDEVAHEVTALTDIGCVPWPPNSLTQELCGDDLFALCIAGYSKKMWGKDPDESVLARITFSGGDSRRFFPDRYVALPQRGYTNFAYRLLDHPRITLHLEHGALDEPCIYTGPLPDVSYRKVQFVDFTSHWTMPTPVVNVCTPALPFTRVTDYGGLYRMGAGPCQAEIPGTGVDCYPLKECEHEAHDVIDELAERHIICAGRLGAYKYLDMDDAVKGAMELCDSL